MTGKHEKQLIRQNFRNAVFDRDNNKCKACQCPAVDAHHITDRREMPNGGYVLENGISLCSNCHVLAEVFHSTGTAAPGFSPEDLYKMIGASQGLAFKKSLEFKPPK